MKALVLTNEESHDNEICSMLKACRITHIFLASSSIEAKKMFAENVFEIIIINLPLKEDFVANFAKHAIKSDAGVVILVDEAVEGNNAFRVEDDGAIIINKTLQNTMLFYGIKMAIAMHRRIIGIRNENKQLQKKYEEAKVVERAKFILIQYLSMSEAQAHRFIEKQAMDMRISKIAVAEGILKTYES